MYDIRKELLQDSIKIISSGHDGNAPIDTSITINNVRIGKEKAISNVAIGEVPQYARKIYYSLKHSSPKYDFKLGDQVEMGDTGEKVKVVKIIPGKGRKIYHWEVYVN